MRILVCGGRNYGHVVRTKALLEDEPAETQERLKEYQYIQTVLNAAVLAHSKERNDYDNWLPTDITIIEGAATGADSAAADFAICNFCPVVEYPADWAKHGHAAGPIRNKKMVDEGKPDLVIAFPGGKGTENMVNNSIASGVKVVRCDGVNIPKFGE
jgi:hypothetical protein